MPSKNDICINMEYVKSLSLDQLHTYTLKYLQLLEKKKKWNRTYNALPNIKKRQREYYYKKHNIYHPEHNPDGINEKRFKKIVYT